MAFFMGSLCYFMIVDVFSELDVCVKAALYADDGTVDAERAVKKWSSAHMNLWTCWQANLAT